MKKRVLKFFVFFIPFLALLGWLGYLELQYASAPRVMVAARNIPIQFCPCACRRQS